jgi:adenylate cyclase
MGYFYKHIKYIILVIYFSELFLPAGAEAQLRKARKIDSLLHQLSTAPADSNKIKILLGLSEYTECADSGRKILYATQAVSLAGSINWPKGVMLGKCKLGTIYDKCEHDYSKSLKYFHEYLDLAIDLQDNESEADALSSIAIDENLSGHYYPAIEYYGKSLQKTSRTDLKIGMLGTIGTIFYDLGDYQNAQQYYGQALNTLEQLMAGQQKKTIEDTLTLCYLLTKTGNIYTSMAAYDKALEKYRAAFDLSSKTDDTYSQVFALKNIGRVYELRKDLVTARACYVQSLEKLKIVGQPVVQAEMQNRLANIFALTGNADSAIVCATDALRLLNTAEIKCERADKYILLSQAYLALGKAYTLQNNYHKAIENLEQALALSDESGSMEARSETWNQFHITYSRMKQPEKALVAYKHFIGIRDSIYSLAKAREVTANIMRSEFRSEQLADSLRQTDAKNRLNLKLHRQKWISFSGMAGFFLVVLFSFVIYRSYKKERKTNQIIQTEKKKSDDLLLNILPKEVADELKSKGRAQAKEFDHVTVMFVDFVNFTGTTEKMTPQELVDELDACFSAFDNIVTRNHMEKIKTIGDAHLSISGLPVPNERHGYDAVKAALEIKEFMEMRNNEQGARTFNFRVGIHSGSVVAGIVGLKKFAYDIWGDAVNTAARMEQNSEPGRINISQTTYEQVKEQFSCICRGEIEAKGKGKLKMYYVS